MNTKRVKLLFSVLLMTAGLNKTIAQGFTDFSKLIPPGPEAASLQRETKVPVDYSTGVASISIPLYEVRTGNVSIPISLNYHASGIKVDQLSSSVGLGWGLSAGGAVQRTIRGKPDEAQGGSFELDITDNYINDMNENITFSDNEYLLSGRDFTQDDYSYNFLGFSGSFYFDHTKTVRQVFKEPVELERLQFFEPYPYYQARDFNGNVYYFKQADWSYIRNRSTNSPTSEDPYGHISSWKLTRVQHQGIDTVSLSYENYSINYEVKTTDIYDKKKQKVADVPGGQCNPICPTCGDDYPDNMYHHISQYGFDNSLIKQIQTRNAKVIFYYSDHSGATVWKRKLDSIVVRSQPDDIVRYRIHLLYELFNGNNQLKLMAVKKMDINNGLSEETKLEYYENPSYPLPGLSSPSRDMFGYINGSLNQFLITTTDTDYPLISANREVNEHMIMLGSLKKMTYKTGGYSEFIYEPQQAPEISATTYGEGMRIKQVNEYDGVNGLTATTYEYFGYSGRTVTSPVNMSPEIREATYRRKIFSSNGVSGSFLVPLTSLVPVGYSYDSVVVRAKGTSHDLMTSYKYKTFIVHNSNKAFLENTSYYQYMQGTNSYEKIKSEFSRYAYNMINDYAISIADVIPSSLLLSTSFYPGGTIYTCHISTPGLSASPIYQYLIQKTLDSSINYTNTGNMANSSRYYYGTMPHLQPIRIVTNNSIDSTITTIKYPAEMVAGGLDNSGVYQQMLTSYLWARKIVEENFNAQGNSMNKTITTYNNWTSGVAPGMLEIGLKGATPEKRKEIKQYDLHGNVQQYEEDGFSHALIWDHEGTVPIVHAINATLDDIAYTSFETNGTGYWNFNGGSYNTTATVTGKRSYTLSTGNTIARTFLPVKNYVISYWLQNGGSITVNGTTGTPGISKNGWTYYSYLLANPGTITIAGTGSIDELRLYPQKAQMITYTYEPLIGMTSQCDANNRIVFYEYDGMRRLSLIRDQDRNILKRFCYRFQGQPIPCGLPTDAVWEYVSSSCEQNGQSQNTGNTIIIEKDINPVSSTYNQTRTTSMQNTASCPVCSVSTCNGVDKKCVNNLCQTGSKVYTSSVRLTSNTWKCTYHYSWGDGSVSPDYEEIRGSACFF